MPNLFLRCMLFVSSYFPLTVIIWILTFNQQPIFAWFVLGIGTVGLLAMLLFFFKIVPSIAPIQDKVISRQAHGADVMGYIASYIIPFVTFPLSGWQQITAMSVFMFILGVIYVNSEDMLRINPTLNLVGMQLYEVASEQSKEPYALITYRHIKNGDILRMVSIGNGIYVEKKT